MEKSDNCRTQHTAQPGGEKPGSAGKGIVPRRLQENLPVLSGPGHLQKIFGGFFPDNIDNIVHRNDANEFVSRINDRYGKEIVLRNDMGHFLLIGIGVHRYHLRIHYIFETPVWLMHEEFTKGKHTAQLAFTVNDVEIEGHLHLFATLLNPLDGIADR